MFGVGVFPGVRERRFLPGGLGESDGAGMLEWRAVKRRGAGVGEHSPGLGVRWSRRKGRAEGMRKRIVIWAGVWAALAALTAAGQVWVRGRAGEGGGVVDRLVPAANALHLVTVPVRAALRRSGAAAGMSPGAITAASAVIGWLALIGALAALNEARLGVIRRGGSGRDDEHAALSRPTADPADEQDGDIIDLARRRFLVNAGCGAAAIGASATGAKAAFVDPADLLVRRYRLPIAGLPAALDGLKIVQVSDTHLGPAVPAELVERAVRRAIALRPDVVALTGDYIEGALSYIEEAARIFSPLVERGGARLGALGVLGNHDWYGDGPAVRSALERIGVRMIDNGRIFLDAETLAWRDDPPEQGLCFAGLGDLDEDATDTDRAFRGVPAAMPRILLCHQPDTVEEDAVRAERVDAALCGHTHGGQIALPLVGPLVIPSRFGRKYAGGLVRGPCGPVVVSRGVGMSIVPIRWNVPPEVVEVSLSCAERSRDSLVPSVGAKT